MKHGLCTAYELGTVLILLRGYSNNKRKKTMWEGPQVAFKAQKINYLALCKES